MGENKLDLYLSTALNEISEQMKEYSRKQKFTQFFPFTQCLFLFVRAIFPLLIAHFPSQNLESHVIMPYISERPVVGPYAIYFRTEGVSVKDSEEVFNF